MADRDEREPINYGLQVPFSYSRGGEQIQAQFIQLSAPTSRNYRECATLKQAFFRAAQEQERERERLGLASAEGTGKDPSGSDMVALLASSSCVDFADLLEVARRLFVSGVALVDGETKLTGALLDRMSMDDMEEMLGDFLVGFTAASALEQTESKSSEAS